MGWRTSPCGGGVGCDDAQSTSLCVVQGQPLNLSVPVGYDISGLAARAEIRTHPGGRLLLDLTPYCLVDAANPSMLLINVPAEITEKLTSSGVYDVWVDYNRVQHGTVYTELAVSRLPETALLAVAWTPTLVMGEPYERTISLAGMVPQDIPISLDPEHPPVLVVAGTNGTEVETFVGPPRLAISPDRTQLTLSLSENDVAAIGVGRYTYTLMAFDVYYEPWTLLAGMLHVSEAVVVNA